jgi:hypothetical protein
LKQQLARAGIAAIDAVRRVDPAARFVQAEPIIHISADPEKPEDEEGAARHTESQYEAWDLLAGRRDPEIGGGQQYLDVLGVNFYWNNEWIHEGDRTPPGHDQHRPLHTMLEDLWARYGRPIIIAETGTEAGAELGWLGYVAAEVRQAIRSGVPVLGICLYPVMDYPGWDDGRHCRCGLIAAEVTEAGEWAKRRVRPDLCDEVLTQGAMMDVFKSANPNVFNAAENLRRSCRSEGAPFRI